MSRWNQFENALQEVREQQVEDFRVVMVALATTRNSLDQVRAGLDQVRGGLDEVRVGLEKHQEHNQKRLELIELAARAESEDIAFRLDQIEGRLERLEHPAA